MILLDADNKAVLVVKTQIFTVLNQLVCILIAVSYRIPSLPKIQLAILYVTFSTVFSY